MTELYSFDVFDTLITRPYARPRDLFRQLAVDILGYETSPSELMAFAQQRVEAESRARQLKGNRDDITLTSIYTEFKKLGSFGQWADMAMEREISLEVEMVSPIRSGIELARSFMESGHRVVFISDMYLPSQVITDMLRRAGINIDLSLVYVSGEIGFSKHSGRLFDYVRQQEMVASRHCSHTGDNWKADVLRPRQRGWQATLFSESILNRYEDMANREPYWLATRAGGVSRASRLRQVSKNVSAARLAADVIGPFLTSFVCHVLLDAKCRGLDTLYFVSRDGQILLKIAKALQATGLAPEIDCRYLYGSRQAWFLPTVTEAKLDHIKWAFPKGASSAPRDILRRLEFEPAEVSNLLDAIGFNKENLDCMQSEGQVNQFVNRLLSSPASNLIIQRAEHKRKTLVNYLGEQGILHKNRKYALVDVGWSLQSQAAVKRCLAIEGYSSNIHGYYLGVGAEHVPLDMVGGVNAFVSQKENTVPSRLVADWFFRLSTILLIEHLFTLADHPSLASYKNSDVGIIPIFKPHNDDCSLKSFTEHLHQELIAYAQFSAKNFGEDLAADEFVNWSIENVRLFVCEPSSDDVRPIAWLPANREITHDSKHTAQLANPLNVPDILKMALHDLLPRRENYFSSYFAWHDGAIAISPIHVRGIYRSLRYLGRQLKKITPSRKTNF